MPPHQDFGSGPSGIIHVPKWHFKSLSWSDQMGTGWEQPEISYFDHAQRQTSAHPAPMLHCTCCWLSVGQLVVAMGGWGHGLLRGPAAHGQSKPQLDRGRVSSPRPPKKLVPFRSRLPGLWTRLQLAAMWISTLGWLRGVRACGQPTWRVLRGHPKLTQSTCVITPSEDWELYESCGSPLSENW